MQGYRAAKQQIFNGAQSAVVNADDASTWPEQTVAQIAKFSSKVPTSENEWGLALYHDKLTLMQGAQPGLAIDELKMAGQHNYLNALAALAMGQALGFADAPMCHVLREFKGLIHRSEVIASINSVTWVNDSKGTNVGATLAAINGIGANLEGRLILLAGG
ncbi:Mur ligase family protein, partial [Leclercia adecarboxylata]|uniref:Mur ligase family protein n=1 Tax=Leclercia adecarboxylata TaxID=83655 RepID=UPI00234D562C